MSATNLLSLLKEFEHCCKAKEEDFHPLGQVNRGTFGDYIFIPSKDPNCKVLGVAHLDYVARGNHFQVWKCVNSETKREEPMFEVRSPRLDDRAGVFTLLHALPSMGVNVDVLLTTNEEHGASTASDFKTEKQYNWMFSFDRAGSDVVTYQYDSPSMEKSLRKVGFKIGSGSYSCICDLEHLDCMGFNVGTGLRDGHSNEASLSLNVLVANINKFNRFYLNRKAHHLSGKVKQRYFNYGTYGGGWNRGGTYYGQNDSRGWYFDHEKKVWRQFEERKESQLLLPGTKTGSTLDSGVKISRLLPDSSSKTAASNASYQSERGIEDIETMSESDWTIEGPKATRIKETQVMLDDLAIMGEDVSHLQDMLDRGDVDRAFHLISIRYNHLYERSFK